MRWPDLVNLPLNGILQWAETQPWCQAMAACIQDASWHAEGDVWTHTKMVCAELERLEEWNDLTTEQRIVLTFAALFHDAAKPLTTETDPVTGRVRSPQHAVKGELLARNALRLLGCDLVTREQICGLVRYHGRPAFLAEREHPEQQVVTMSWLSNNFLLYLFAKADTRGRITAATDRPEENLELWKLTASESNCLHRPYPFENDRARYVYLNSDAPNLSYVPYENPDGSTVTLMCGLPGAGKDTWLQSHHSEIPVVSLDAIRRELRVDPTDNQGVVAQAAKEQCRQFLRSGTDFAFNATNLLRTTRSRWLKLFASYDARIEIVYLEPDLRTILRQNSKRNAKVPTEVIQKLSQRIEPPTWMEADRIRYLEHFH